MAMLILPTLLQCMLIGSLIFICKALSNIDSHVASLDTSANALYFAWDEDKASIDYFLDAHNMDVVSILKTKPIVDYTCSALPIQLEFTYLDRWVSLLFLYKIL